MAMHQDTFQLLKRPPAVNSKDMRVTLNDQREIDDDEEVIINIAGKEENSISSSEGGQGQLAEISSDEGFEDD